MTATAEPTHDTEHFLDAKSSGLGSLGAIGTTLLFAVLLLSVFLMKTVGFVIGAGALVVGLAVIGGAAFPHPVTKKSVLSRAHARASHNRAAARGRNQYRSGPLTTIGSYRLPGILASTQLHEATTSTGDRYGIVEMTSTNDFAVTWEAHPDGVSTIEDADFARYADKWGQALAFLCKERGVVQVMVTIETAPDSGEQFRKRLTRRIVDGAPAAAVSVIRDLGDQAVTGGSAIVQSWVTVTFRGESAGKKRNAVELAASLATRLPQITSALSASGAGRCTLVPAQAIVEEVRMAYDPGCADDVRRARESGKPIVMRWDSIGPAAADSAWSYYRHASGLSRSWSMTDILGAVHVRSLAALLQPHDDITRKRVSLIFETRSPGDAPHVARSDVNSSKFRGRKANADERDIKRMDTAYVNAHREARGDGLVDVAVMVTATVMNQDRDGQPWLGPVSNLPAAEAAVDSLAPQGRLQLRPEDGAQAAAFAMNLPMVGVVAQHHTRIPVALREKM